MEIPILRHLQTRGALIAVNAAAALALIFAAASVALEINDVWVARNMVGSPDNSAAGQPREADFQVNEIVSVHLMGNPARARVARVERAPTTQLNLTLKGLLFTDDQDMARAIISIGKKKGDKLYAVGDKLESGNATVKEIRDDLVLLDRSGKIESLPLPKKLTSDNISADALYVPPVTQNTASVVGDQATNPMADSTEVQIQANIPPPRRDAVAPNFSGVEDVIKRMGGVIVPPAAQEPQQ